MLRGDEVDYVGDMSPYGKAHVLCQKNEYAPYGVVDSQFSPQRKVAVGCVVVTKFRPYLLGKCLRIQTGTKKKSKKLNVWIQDPRHERPKIRPLKSCFRPPAINEFIRHRETKNWYQVKGHEQTTVLFQKVLVSPSASAPANNANAPAPANNANAPAPVATAPVVTAQSAPVATTPATTPAEALAAMEAKMKKRRIESIPPRLIVQSKVRHTRLRAARHIYAMHVYAQTRTSTNTRANL